ncbi:uncharacterized protein MONOS_17959 [Monocercomonoides exilis]|uniref:uncharacterized protein n=1 Tax=Monocercomonoides exilis TaxID=2049356 RepID=UPI003559FA05|nr:hypothetical protein MONOS_17959 [Monocercomonoides exilis]
MALFALSRINRYFKIEKKLYLKEIKEIIKYHQEHQNLTRLAYQSAWMFLMERFYDDQSLEDDIVNDLHFAIEAAREIEYLTKCIDWKRKDEEVFVVKRWLIVVADYFLTCTLCNVELAGLMSSIAQLFRAAREYYREISSLCIYPLRNAAEKKNVKIDDLLKSGVIDAVLEEIRQPTLDDEMAGECFEFFALISERLKGKEEEKMKEAKRKEKKRKIFERMEEEGYEDCITSIYGEISFVNEKYYLDLSLNISDYFVNV